MAENTGSVQTQCPALMIGLGGTGKQVLLNFRRMYYERYGSKHPPFVGHIWIDTDPRNLLLDGREMDFLMKEVDFDEGEKVDVELQKADLQNFYDHPNDYPHIFSWFDRRLEKFGHIINGAGGIRSFGRLAFFRYYDEIMKSVREMHGKIGNVEIHNEALRDQNIILDGSALDVWLIFSVAGGTGSGMFLDLAFALRDRWPNVHIRSVIVLPSVFSNNKKERIYGNGYAALMELEHYQYGKAETDTQEDLHRFPLAWTREMYDQSRTQPGPVFDSTYLIDNSPASNAGNLALEDKNALCRMIAEWLYIEYGSGADVSGLVAERRAIEVNFGTVLNRVFPYQYQHNGLNFTEVFSCRYSSFGLSKLYIPVDRVETGVQHRLVKDFIEFWTVERSIPANLDELLENENGYLHQAGINNNSTHRDFIRAIESGGTGDRLAQRLENLIWNEKRGEFLNMANSPQVRQKISRWMQDSLLQGQLNRGDVVQEHWGSITKSIAQNSEKHYQTATHNLQQWVTRILSEPKHRFEVAREVLRRMRDKLNKDAEQFKAMEERNRSASNNAAKQVQLLLQWLDDVKGPFTRKTVIEVALEEIERRVKRELQAQIAGASAELASQIADYIGRGVKDRNAQGDEITVETGLIKQLMDYRYTLRNEVLTRLNERIRAFDKIEPSPIYQEMSEGAQETTLFYVDQYNRPIGENTLMEWEKRFFEKQDSNGPKDLWDMRHTLKQQGENKLIDRLLDFASDAMRHVKEKTVDTIERLTQRHKQDSAAYRAVVDRLLSYAQPWLPEPNHFVDREKVLNQRQYAYWVARHPRSSEAHLDFEKEVKRQSQDYKLLDTTPDRIYAASEVAGFPLMVIPELDRYRNDAYQMHLENGEVLHTDLAFEKFQDLLIKKPDEVESYIDTLGVFLQATLLGIIKVDKSNKDEAGSLMKYRYIDESQIFPETIELGPFSVAISRLARHKEKSLRKRIHTSVVDATKDMDDKTLRKWCALLSFHAGGGREASYYSRFPKDHVVRAIFRREAEMLINQNGERMKQAAKTEMVNLTTWALEKQEGKQHEWALEKPEGSGIFILEGWKRVSS